MIFVWFFKLILFCLKRFVSYLSEFQVLIVLAILFMILLFLVYKELKKGLGKIGDIHFSSGSGVSSNFWGFLSLIIPGLERIPQVPGRYVVSLKRGIGIVSLN